MALIARIRLQQFRSYADDSFEFNPGINIIVGPNASGKTNLLEAILVVAHGGSYRTRDTDLVQFGQPWARIDAYADAQQRTVKLAVIPQPEKTYELDGKLFKRLTMERMLPVVLFEPNHLSLLTGSPERRRDYLDELLVQMLAGYGSTVRAYRRTLAQRNRLLKSAYAAPDQLFPWNVRLSELGARLVRARMQLAQSINEKVGALYHELSADGAAVTAVYRTAAAPEQYESYMLRQLEARVADDQARGFTSFGPHRDDLAVLFAGRPAEEVASRGETRTFVLALKIIELQLLEERRAAKPLLLLDDVFSELDGARRKALTTHLQPYQTFITTTDADVVALAHAPDTRVVTLAGMK